MNKEAIISAKKISIGYPKARKRKETILYSDLSFNLYAGELTSLLGPNGAGKSTLLRTLSMLQKPLTGDILLDGKDLYAYKEYELATKVGLVLTDKTAIGGLTVSELVALGRYPYTGFFGHLSKSDKQIIDRAMSDVCIIHKAHTYVAELSDGERQKVMIAKALAQECPIILLDEPTAFLDVTSRIEIMTLLHHLASNQHKTILLSTHDIELALLLSDRLWLLSDRGGLKCGVTEDIILNNDLDHFFGNENIVFNKHIGSFLPVTSHSNKVYVEAESTVRHWLSNFLHRNGYCVSTELSETLFSIKINNLSSIEILKNDDTFKLSSFEELKQWIENQLIYC